MRTIVSFIATIFTNVNPGVQVLMAADTGTLKDPKLATAPGEKLKDMFPLAWCHEFEGARVFYTSLGHKIEYYSDLNFESICWAASAG